MKTMVYSQCIFLLYLALKSGFEMISHFLMYFTEIQTLPQFPDRRNTEMH